MIEKHFNSKEVKEKIHTLKDMYKDYPDNIVFNIMLSCYKQMLEQIEILKSINDFKPDELGINKNDQFATFCYKVTTDHLKKIGEL